MYPIKRLYTTLDSVAKSDTGSIVELISEPRVVIKQFEIACSSTNFTVYIFDREIGGANTINEVYKIASINLHHTMLEGTPINAWNTSPAQSSIYIQIKNDDNTNATGPIAVKMFYDKSITLD